MTGFTRRAALLGGVAATTLAACGQKSSDALTPASSSVAAKAVPPAGWESGLTIARRITFGETTSLAEVEKAIARAEAVNGDINAIATASFDAARAVAADRSHPQRLQVRRAAPLVFAAGSAPAIHHHP